MIQDKLFGATKIPLLTKGLDAFALRHRAIADNVANTETIGYKRRYVSFEDNLKQAVRKDGLTRTSRSHMGSGGFSSESKDVRVGSNRINMDSISPQLKIDSQASDVNDLNNIDIDQEMGDMAQNHLKFTFTAKLDKAYFELLNMSIKGI